MIFNKMFFPCSSPLSTSSYNAFSYDNSKTVIILKNQLNHQMNIVILKNLSQDNYLYCPRFLTKNLNTAQTPTEMKQNLVDSTIHNFC